MELARAHTFLGEARYKKNTMAAVGILFHFSFNQFKLSTGITV
jgi:hypothetical protein